MAVPGDPEPETMAIDLDAYLARIGYDGPREPTRAVLRDLVRHHTEAIPFENLNPFFGWPVELDLDALQRKLVHGGRGGYCFEQNSLMQAVLGELGFSVTALAARVVWGQPDDAITARGHMLLRVDLDEPYLVDVGFGGLTQTAPLRLEPDVEQDTPHEPFRLQPRGNDWFLQARVGDEWRTTYRFDLTPQYPVDFEVSNYYLSTHPSSHFRHGLIAARPEPGRRYALRNLDLSIHQVDGSSEKRRLADPEELGHVLRDLFDLSLPADADLEATFERLA